MTVLQHSDPSLIVGIVRHGRRVIMTYTGTAKGLMAYLKAERKRLQCSRYAVSATMQEAIRAARN